jgi:hypothetical protein
MYVFAVVAYVEFQLDFPAGQCGELIDESPDTNG